MGSTHFLTKGLERVKTEMSLHVLAYRRLMAILGMASMMNAIRAFARFPHLYERLWAVFLLAPTERPKRSLGVSRRFLMLCN